MQIIFPTHHSPDLALPLNYSHFGNRLLSINYRNFRAHGRSYGSCHSLTTNLPLRLWLITLDDKAIGTWSCDNTFQTFYPTGCDLGDLIYPDGISRAGTSILLIVRQRATSLAGPVSPCLLLVLFLEKNPSTHSSEETCLWYKAGGGVAAKFDNILKKVLFPSPCRFGERSSTFDFEADPNTKRRNRSRPQLCRRAFR
jgi:hypothetical protein